MAVSQTLQEASMVACISGVTLLSVFLSGALTISLPSIAQSIDIPEDQLQWPLSIYSLTNGCFLLLAGGLADVLGRKLMFLVGTVWFSVFSLIASFASNSITFIVLVGLLGLGPAMLSPAAVGILGSYFPDGNKKNRAFAALGAGQPVGFIVGLLAGGLFAQLRWQAIFWLEAGLAAICACVAWFCLSSDSSYPSSIEASDEPAQRNGRYILKQLRTFDWVGSALSTCGLVSLTFALADSQSAPQGWRTPYIPALLPTSALLLGSFLFWERSRERRGLRALMPFSIWRSYRFGSLMAIVFLSWASFNTLTYFSTFMYQEIQHRTPLMTSVLYLPMVGAGLLLNCLAAPLTGRTSVLKLVAIGLFGSMAGCIVFALLEPSSNYGLGMFWVMVLAVGPDLFFSACNIMCCKSVPSSQQALAGSLFNTNIRIATSLGLAVCSTVSTAVTTSYARAHHMDASLPVALLAGYRAASWTCLGASAVALAISLVSLRGVGVVGKVRPSSVVKDDGGNNDGDGEGVRMDVVSGGAEVGKSSSGPSTTTGEETYV